MTDQPDNSVAPTNDRASEDVWHGNESVWDYLDQGTVSSRRKSFNRLRTRRRFLAGGIAALGAAIWFGVPLNTEGAFFPGTMVGDLNIAELDKSEALALMQLHFNEFENTAVDFHFEQQIWNASLAQLGFGIDYEGTLEAAWQHGRDSSRTSQLLAVLVAPEKKSYPVLFHADDAVLNEFLKGLSAQIVGAAHDAVLYLDSDQVRIQPDENGRALDIEGAADATRRSVQSAKRGTVALQAQPVTSQITAAMLEPKRDLAQTMINGPIQVSVDGDMWQVSQSTLRAALILPEQGVLTDPTFDERIINESLNEIATAVERSPENAVLGWDNGLYVVTEDVRGRVLDTTATTSSILAAARTRDARTIQAQYEELLADVRVDNMNELGIIDLVALGDSNFQGSAWERAENVRVSAEHLTHTLVAPGDTYSFNASVGAITLENGFVQGKIIRGTRIVEDIGGGACQASTTVFRAALMAGFPIDHEYHQYRLAMYEHDGWPPGLDAAIFQPDDPSDWELDLYFINTTDNWLLVEFYTTEDERAYCAIYGTPQGWDVSIDVPYISDPKKPEPPIETEDPKLEKGERQQVGFATNGYDVQAVRTITRNGDVVQQEGLANPWEFWSHFQPQRDEFLIGPGTPREFDDKNTPTATSESGN